MNVNWAYDKLYSAIGNSYGVCGLLGNLQAESRLNPKNLQDSFNEKFDMTDDQYTNAVDSGAYNNFVNDSAGYGLAQWTFYNRKQNLLNFAKSRNCSIGDENMQLDFLINEIKSYTKVWKVLVNAKSVKEASDAVLTGFEKPKNQSEAVKKQRANNGEELYAQIVGTKVIKKKVLPDILGPVNGLPINLSIPCNPNNYTVSNERSIEYLVIHYTGNSYDTARSNCNYFKGAGRKASAHYFVDEQSIFSSVNPKDIAWHCGTSGKYYHDRCRNTNSIGIEMCCSGQYIVSERTKDNTAYLCAYICKILGITSDKVDKFVLRHYDITRKNCPAQMSGDNNAEWNDFKRKIKNILGEVPVTETKTEKVRVSISNLNIRKGPGTNYSKTGKTTGIGVFTITEIVDGDGSNTGWGKLKSGLGWICLDYTTKLE